MIQNTPLDRASLVAAVIDIVVAARVVIARNLVRDRLINASGNRKAQIHKLADVIRIAVSVVLLTEHSERISSRLKVFRHSDLRRTVCAVLRYASIVEQLIISVHNDC